MNCSWTARRSMRWIPRCARPRRRDRRRGRRRARRESCCPADRRCFPPAWMCRTCCRSATIAPRSKSAGSSSSRPRARWRKSPVPVVAAIAGHAPGGRLRAGAVLRLPGHGARARIRIGLNETQVGLVAPKASSTCCAASSARIAPNACWCRANWSTPNGAGDRPGRRTRRDRRRRHARARLARGTARSYRASRCCRRARSRARTWSRPCSPSASSSIASSMRWFSPDTQAGLRALVAQARQISRRCSRQASPVATGRADR